MFTESPVEKEDFTTNNIFIPQNIVSITWIF